jgi:hypothetical protein
MDLTKTLQSGHNKQITTQIADYVGDNAIRFKELVKIFMAGPYRMTQRAAWPLSLCVERHPKLISPHLGKILRFATLPDVHDAVTRNTVRLLQFIDVPRKYRGQVVSMCFGYLATRGTPIAIQAFSITVLHNVSDNEPGLRRELRMILEGHLPYASPGYRARAQKVLRDLRNDSL